MSLMMLASLTAVCQYPLTKKIGQQEVVIMTTKQAEDINTKFLRMQDSIATLKQVMQTQTIQHQFTVANITDSLSKTHIDLRYKTGEADWYRKEYYSYKNDSYKYLRSVQRDMDILICITAVLTGIVTLIYK